MKLQIESKNLIRDDQKAYIKKMEFQMTKCLDKKEQEIQELVYKLLSVGYEPPRVIDILAVIYGVY